MSNNPFNLGQPPADFLLRLEKQNTKPRLPPDVTRLFRPVSTATG